jgi:SAM-dependent methyltransferase
VREVFAAAARSYGRGNPLLVVERPETAALLPALAGEVVLDLGSGPGHYAGLARAAGARLAVALDLTPEMLADSEGARVVADAARLPFAGGVADVAVMALALSYVADWRAALCETARVLRPGGVLVLSDLHPDARRRGWRRSFPGATGGPLVLDASVPERPALDEGLQAAGLVIEAQREVAVDDRLEPEFRRAGRRDFDALRGAPLLVLVRARRGGPHAG